MTMLIPFAGLSPVPWKNGAGSTTEIAVFPQDAGFTDFDWRVSLATIGADGPFSVFPGVDRTLALVEGHGGTSTDFNAMTRTDRCYHSFGRRRLDGPSTFVARAPVTVLFLAEGESLELSSEDERIAMVRYDAMLLDQGTVWKLDAGQGTIFIVDIHYYDDEDDLDNEDGHYDD